MRLSAAGVDVEVVLEITVPDEEIIRRMSGRRVHPGSGRTYHVEYNPPREEGLDDETGEALIQRDDDKRRDRAGAPDRLPRTDCNLSFGYYSSKG